MTVAPATDIRQILGRHRAHSRLRLARFEPLTVPDKDEFKVLHLWTPIVEAFGLEEARKLLWLGCLAFYGPDVNTAQEQFDDAWAQIAAEERAAKTSGRE